METASNTNLTADEMILANGAAEAREADRLRDTADRYAAEMEELKALYNKNCAVIDELREISAASGRDVQGVVDKAIESIDAANASIRNVDFTELQSAVIAAIQELQNKTADLVQQSDDFSHKENVRVYRNIQAATDQLLQKQTQSLTEALEPLKAPKKTRVNGVQITTLVLAAVAVALEIVNLLGTYGLFTL